MNTMFWGSRAPWSRSEDRCDGANFEADGARPPVKPGPMLPVLGVLVFRGDTALMKFPSSGLRIYQTRSWLGRFCPAFKMGFSPLATEDGGIADNAALSGPVK